MIKTFQFKSAKLVSLIVAFLIAVVSIYVIRDNISPAHTNVDVKNKSTNLQTESADNSISKPFTAGKKQNIPDFSNYIDVNEKKAAFFNYLRPMIARQNQLIKSERQQLLALQAKLNANESFSSSEESLLLSMAEKYQVKEDVSKNEILDKLLNKVDVIPENLVLIQAANETGWGSSRFAKQGNNFFGQWCFKTGCGLVPLSRTSGLKHEVAVFDSVEDSVASYMKNLNTNAAYETLREIRQKIEASGKTPGADDLIHGLINYSERQHEYVNELLDMLRHNQKFLVVING